MIKGACHCGAVKYEFNDDIEFGTKCNCSICSRLGTVWIYSEPENIKIISDKNAAIVYSFGDKNRVFHSCKTCGTTTQWQSTDVTKINRMAVNLNMADKSFVEKTKVRHFDGADSWKFLD